MYRTMLTGLFAAATALFLGGCGKDSSTPPASGAAMPLPETERPLVDAGPAMAGEDNVLVTVDGKVLKQSQADEMARQLAARQGVPAHLMDQMMQRYGEQLRHEAIEQFVDQTLMAEEANRRNIPVSEQEITNAVDALRQRLPPGASLEEALASQGATMADLRRDIITNERMGKLFRAETEAVPQATDEEVNAFYTNNTARFTSEEKVAARHILIGCDKEADEAAHTKAKADAEAVRKQLLDGADFAALAKEKSSCPSKERGGDLGEFGRGQMVPEFDTAAFSQVVGEIGPVVKTPFGYHVLQVTSKQEAGVQKLEEVSDRIRGHLASRARDRKFKAYLQTLRAGAKIEYAVAAAASPAAAPEADVPNPPPAPADAGTGGEEGGEGTAGPPPMPPGAGAQ